MASASAHALALQDPLVIAYSHAMAVIAEVTSAPQPSRDDIQRIIDACVAYAVLPGAFTSPRFTQAGLDFQITCAMRQHTIDPMTDPHFCT